LDDSEVVIIFTGGEKVWGVRDWSKLRKLERAYSTTTRNPVFFLYLPPPADANRKPKTSTTHANYTSKEEPGRCRGPW